MMGLGEYARQMELEITLIGLIAKFGATAIIDSTRLLDAKRREKQEDDRRRAMNAGRRDDPSLACSPTQNRENHYL